MAEERLSGKRAVALLYNPDKATAPQVVASGTNLVAEKIIATAAAAGVHIKEDPDLVEILIDDSGRGVPVEIRERIFEPFFTTKAEGSGLGLPIVHAIVTQHGGTITVEDAPEGGARFALRVPRAR